MSIYLALPFPNFQNRQYQKKINSIIKSDDFAFVNPVTGIDELDLHYPLKLYDTVLILAQSGIGKTTLLTFIAVENARKGAKVLYIAAEGTVEEMNDRIDSCWSSVPRFNIESGNLNDDEITKLNKVAEQVTSLGGDRSICL